VPRKPTLSDVAVEAGVSLKTVSRYLNGHLTVDPLLSDRIAAAVDTVRYRRRVPAESRPRVPTGTRSPTMRDVALHAGVALKTVSRYVNGETNIDPVLADRIGAAIARLGYRRNLAAASIRPGRTGKMLGLIISDLANPYYSALSRAIEVYARDYGYLLTIASSDEEGTRHDQLLDRLLGQQVDGLIVVPPRRPGRAWSQLTPPIPPVVFLDRPVDFDGADTVLADNAAGARAATCELRAHGAVNVAFVGDSPEIYTIAERLRGYREAHRDAGIRYREELVLTGAHDREQAAGIVAELLRGSAADAVFAANNRAAVGALEAFREAGRRLPLIGFDDFEAACLMSPQVSVVSQDIAAMGRTAAEIVISRIRGADMPHATHVVPTRLVLRGSERPATARVP
jgi:LacI family transcriptional regulator